ncbi:MAG TPA: hypothetical protein DIV79_03995 [Opitutae bacterium]|nr:hypothetical protein [Opitutaceae bacterium]HCR29160.1 hypothetical protein [Opitutae bacterium]
MQIGIIDIGSNSIKLLIGESNQTGRFDQIRFEVEEKRIGEGMTLKPPRILEADIEKGAKAIARLHQIARPYNLAELKIVATSAVRDAANQTEFATAILDRTGIGIDILSGDDEARLIGKGALQDPDLFDLGNFILIDLGGGSMECIQFENRVQKAHQSFNLGAVRLASSYIENRALPLSPNDERSIEEHVTQTLSHSSARDHSGITTAVLTGGASSILDALLFSRSNSASATISDLQSLCQEICSANLEDRVTRLGIPRERADIFPTAATIIRTALENLKCDVARFTRYNLRAGLIAEMLEN